MCGSKEYSKQATLTDEMKQRAITNNILEPRGSEKDDQCHTQFQLSLSNSR